MTSGREHNEEIKKKKCRSEKCDSSILHFFHLSQNVSHLDLSKQISTKKKRLKF